MGVGGVQVNQQQVVGVAGEGESPRDAEFAPLACRSCEPRTRMFCEP